MTEVETAKEIVTKTALADSVLALVLLLFVVAVFLACRRIWKDFFIPFRDRGISYLDAQAAAMMRMADSEQKQTVAMAELVKANVEQTAAMKGLHDEIKQLPRRRN